MKHPHCNRSRGAHLFWCRGFAPIVFILAVALIVVSVGSGIYFATKKSAPAVVAVQPVASSQPIEVAAATSSDTAPPVTEVKPIASLVPVKAVGTTPVTSIVDCGSSARAAKCLAAQVQNCSPAKGVVTDTSSGLRVERIIDGYKGGSCSYRSNIISGTGSMAILAGMNIDCMIPKASLSKTLQGGSMTQEDMFTLCTGTFIDLIRAQRTTSQ